MGSSFGDCFLFVFFALSNILGFKMSKEQQKIHPLIILLQDLVTFPVVSFCGGMLTIVFGVGFCPLITLFSPSHVPLPLC